MKKVNTNLALLAIAAGLVTFNSCSSDDLYEGDQTLKEYEENFKSTFGEIDPNQDWNMATRSSVTVSVPKTTDVEIYAKIGDEYKCVGDYSKVSGTQTLEFDILKGCEDLMVYANKQYFDAKIGGTVDVTASRAMMTKYNTDTVKVSDAESEIILDNNDVFMYQTLLPEGGNKGKTNDNRGKATQNFVLKAGTTDIVIYPIYWNTSNTNTAGVYYYDAYGNKVEVPFYESKDTDNSSAMLLRGGYLSEGAKSIWNGGMDESSYYTSAIGTAFSAISADSRSKLTLTEKEKTNLIKALDDSFGEDKCVTNIGLLSWGGVWYSTEWKAASGAADSNASIDSNYQGKIKSKGIKLSILEGTTFGLYITHDGKSFYSDASDPKLNTDAYYTADGTIVEGKQACHAVTYNMGGHKYYAFEDWYDENNSSDMDLNDLIFRIDGVSDSQVIDKDKVSTDNPFSWIIACEDLGSTNDYDFNDVVVKISHVAGSGTVNITPLAAGGTLPSYIYYNNDDEPLGEIHELIDENAKPNANGRYTVLNCGGGTDTNPGATITKAVGADYSIAAINKAGAASFGGFSIKVQGDDGKTAKSITASETGEVPQMFLVSDTWKWPKEGKGIEKAYPSFSTWVGNANALDWENNKNDDLIYQGNN